MQGSRLYDSFVNENLHFQPQIKHAIFSVDTICVGELGCLAGND